MNLNWKIKGGIIAGVLLVIGLIVWGKIDSEYNAGMSQEKALSASYQINQTVLDTSTKVIVESVGIANLKAEKLREILHAAVVGRYENKDGQLQSQAGGAMFSAIKEAYPEIDLKVYDKIVDLIIGEREKFRGAQSVFLDQLRTYETWKTKGLLRQWFVAKYFPSDNLVARIGTRSVKGAAALEQMHLIVTSEGTDDAFNTGKQGPLSFDKK